MISRRRLPTVALIAATLLGSMTPAPGTAAEPRLVRTLACPFEPSTVAWSPDGRSVAAGGLLDRRILVFEVGTGRQVRALAAEAGGVDVVAWSPDGAYLATGRAFVRVIPGRVAINLWDPRTGRLIRNLRGPFAADDASNDVRSLAFSPDSRLLASGRGRGGIVIHRLANGEVLRTLTVHAPDGVGLAWSPDGAHLAATGQDRGRAALLFDAATGALVRHLQGDVDRTLALAYGPDGRFVAGGDGSGTVHVWEAATGRRVTSIAADAHRIRSLHFGPDARHLVTTSGDRAIRFWTVPAGAAAGTIHAPGQVTAAASSPDGRRLAATGGSRVWVWELW